MTGRISSGDLVEVVPVSRNLRRGDIVLCKVNGRQFLHLVTAIGDGRYEISNNHGYVNGWADRDAIFGILAAVNPP